MSANLFISYALPHCTTEMVKEVFDTVFQNCVVKIVETTKTDRNTGKPFKMFWVTLDCGRSNWTLGKFIAEIEKHGNASLIYETTKGQDRWWNVRINKEKVKTVPRILERTEGMSREEVAFTKTNEFAAEVAKVHFEIVEPGEIVEGKRKATGAAGKGTKGAKR
jgi:hypothetical protein